MSEVAEKVIIGIEGLRYVADVIDGWIRERI